jgi:WD40 repeat protein
LITGLDAVGSKSELVSLSWDGTLRHWHVDSDLKRRTFSSFIEMNSPAIMAKGPEERQVLIGSVRMGQSLLQSLPGVKSDPIQFPGDTKFALADGSVVTSLPDGIAIWNSVTQRRTNFVAVPTHGENGLSFVVDIPERKCVALLTNGGTLLAWDLASNELSRFRTKEAEKVKAIALQPDGVNLFVTTSNSELLSVELKDWNRRTLMRLPAPGLELDLHSEGQSVLIACSNQSAVIVDLANYEIVTTLSAPSLSLDFARFVPGDRVVTHGTWGSKSVDLWDAKSGTLLASETVERVHALEFDEGRSAFGVAADSGLLVWNLTNNERQVVDPNPCQYVSFVGDKLVFATEQINSSAPDGSRATETVQLKVWDPETKQILANEQLDRHVTRILPLGVTEKYLVSSYSYGLQAFDADKMQLIKTLDGHLKPLVMATFGQQPGQVFTVAADGKLLEHSLVTGAHTVVNASPVPTGGKEIRQLLMSSNNSSAVAVLEGDVIKHWDLRTGTESDFTFEEGIRQVALAPDGQSLLVVTGRGRPLPGPTAFDLPAPPSGDNVTLLEVATNNRRQIRASDSAVDTQFLDSGRKIAVLTGTGAVQVFETTKLQTLFTIRSSRRIVQLLEEPDDKPMLVTATKNKLSLWNVTNGELISEVPLDMSWSAANELPSQLLRSVAGSYYMLLEGQNIFKRPTNVLDYAKKIAPHQLTDAERLKLLSSPLAN